MTREEGKINKNTERNSGHIGFRVWELAERQRGKGLNFKILTGSELGGAEGMVMVISNNDIVVSSGSLAQMPLEHQELMTDKNAALVLTRTDCVHLKSSGSGVKKELGVSFIFSGRSQNDVCGATMIRWEGESILNQSFILERDEMLFIIANEVSLTAKNGPLDVLVKAGVEIDEFWESNTVGSVK